MNNKIFFLIFIPYALHAMEPDSDTSSPRTPGGIIGQLVQQSRAFAHAGSEMSDSSDYCDSEITPQPSGGDNMIDSPRSGRQSPNTFSRKTQENLTCAMLDFDIMCKEVTPSFLQKLYRQARIDEQMVQRLSESDRMEKFLGYLQEPVPLAVATLSTMSGPVVRSAKRSTRVFPFALLPSLSSSAVYGTGIAAALTFYFAKNMYVNAKLWWRDLKIQRLTDALTSIETVKNFQEALDKRLCALEKSATTSEAEIAEIVTAQTELRDYVDALRQDIDHVVVATKNGLTENRETIASVASIITSLRTKNDEMRIKLVGAVSLSERILDTLGKIKTGKKK